MRYCIARPINGISINGNEYVLNNNNEVMVFDTKESCLGFIEEYVDNEDPNNYLWEYEEEE
jgi:hypothetical protein